MCGLLFCALAATGCGAGPSPPKAGLIWIPVQVLSSGSHCRSVGQGPTATWVAAFGPSDSLFKKTPEVAAPFDGSREAALRIGMGQCPTAGYSLLLAATQAAVDRRVATIRVEWREPAPGSRVAQVLTSPCLVLKFPKAGLDRVRIQDQSGRIRFSLAIP
jgi:hypothetical protein